jgi:hypothetical protein
MLLCFIMPSDCVYKDNKNTHEDGQKYKYLEKSLQTGEESPTPTGS